MNYEYIEQLIDSYFNCETTVQEESILRSFFSQDEIPLDLMKYKDLFRYEEEMSKVTLDKSFDDKMIAIVEKESEKEKNIVTTIGRRFAPLFRAAAVVAIILTIGSAAERSVNGQGAPASENSLNVISPYIKQTNISAAIRIKDNTQAETKTPSVKSDSIFTNNND